MRLPDLSRPVPDRAESVQGPILYGPRTVTPVEIERLKKLKKWRERVGKRLAIDPALVWPTASLERLANATRTLAAELKSSDVRRWQREQFATSLEAFLV